MNESMHRAYESNEIWFRFIKNELTNKFVIAHYCDYIR